MTKNTKKILLVHKESKFDSTKQAVKKVEDVLKKKKLSYKKIPVSMLLKEDLLPFNLIIILGGDGTILKTCKYITTQEVILINSDPEHSEGVITDFPLPKVEQLSYILDGKYKTKLRQRMEVKVNNSQVEDAVLNEVYFGSGKACMISKYEIQYDGKKETQRGSGVIISTGTGSTAWYHSAGGNEFDPEEETAKFLVREAYNKEKLNLTILNGVATGTDFRLIVKKKTWSYL